MNRTILSVTIICLLAVKALSAQESPDVLKAEAPEYAAYLFAYFEGKAGDRANHEQLRFAVSEDAVNWFALNGNQAVISSEEISQSGGIRDPHILRGADGKTFYLTATDMSTARNGWKENPGIVLMRSGDLLHWQHKYINLSETYPEKFGKAYWVWAPQTIYDAKAKKYLIYFTVKFSDSDKLDFYCAYANKDFTGFENEPKLFFSPKYGGIDGDIIYKDGLYHFFYKGNTKDENGKEIESGIKQATSKTLHGKWTETDGYCDAYHGTKTHVEGSSVFRLNNSDEYILMYDLYGSGRYEFQRSRDLYSFSEKPESFTKNFDPRHGSVTGITCDEARRLYNRYGAAFPLRFCERKQPATASIFSRKAIPSSLITIPPTLPLSCAAIRSGSLRDTIWRADKTVTG